DLEAFRYGTLLYLLGADDLTLVSVWNPTFLTALLRPLEAWQERLCFDLGRGTFHPPAGDSALRTPPWTARRHADPPRAARLRSIFRSSLAWPDKLRSIWPRLALISCWTDAAAAPYVREVRNLFPSVEIQPKGLLATEGCVSF